MKKPDYCPNCGAALEGENAAVGILDERSRYVGYDTSCRTCGWSGDVYPDDEQKGRGVSAQEEASASGAGPPTCRLCGEPVVKNREMYDVFEGMHWICFHIVFEHIDADPDEPCEDPSCPWVRLEVLGEELRRLGVDSDELPRLDFLG